MQRENSAPSIHFRLLIFAIAFAVGAAILLPSASRAGMLGDVAPVNKDGSGNITGYGDGHVDLNDLMRVLSAWWGTDPLTPAQLAAADVAPRGGDGAITSADVLLYVRAVVLGLDVDGDGLASEVDTSTSPFSPDTDGDGLCDGPLNSAAAQAGRCTGGEDLNADGLVEANETNPAAADTDGDGLCDGPLNSAAAQAGLCSGGEDLNGNGQRDANETSAVLADTDGDGLCDGSIGWAVNPKDPTQVVCSGSEIANGTDPLNPTTHNGILDSTYLQQGTPCSDCFALFIMPDTQQYVNSTDPLGQPNGDAHLKTVAQYACDNFKSWTEPETGKAMPIVAVAQLGDLVQTGSDEGQWQQVSAAFDVLDACGVPYTVVPGNHDYAESGSSNYSQPLPFFNEYFGAPCMPGSTACLPQNARSGWAAHFCANTPICDIMSGQWFVGSGDDIKAGSRDTVAYINGTLTSKQGGPPTDEPGRHRAILVPTPNGGQLLIIGLDLSFDFGWNDGSHGDDLAWVKSLLNAYPNTPTILVHHWLFTGGAQNFPAVDYAGSDTYDEANAQANGSANWAQMVWNELVVPYPEVFMTLDGHYINGTYPTIATVPTPVGTSRTVYRVMRNFETVQEKAGSTNLTAGGAGWNTIAVFDPGAGAIRLRSYRIDDVDYYRTRAAYRQGLISSSGIDVSHDGTDPGGTGPGNTLPSTYQLDHDANCGATGQPRDCPVTLQWNLP